MEINDYQCLAMRTSGNYVSELDQLLNGVLGFCGESAEVHEEASKLAVQIVSLSSDLVKSAGKVSDSLKKHIFQGHSLDMQPLIKEMGDALWYLALMCTACQVNMSDVAEQNIEKLKKRYPQGFSVERSVNREE